MSPEASRTLTIDCDTHFWQPAESWTPRVNDRWRLEVEQFMNEWMASTSALSREMQLEKFQSLAGADDPTERLRWMDEEAVDVNVIFPGAGLVSMMSGAGAAAAACRALNEWSADFASKAPERLLPTMILPMRYPDEAVAELKHARSLGLRIAFAPPTPARERCWSDTALDPLWSELEATSTPLAFHEISRLPKDGGEMVARHIYKDSYPFMYFCGHLVETQLAIMDMIGGGVLERFPGLRVGVVEANVAWLPGWLASMDDLWGWLSSRKQQPKGTLAAPLKASDYFKRQCFIAAFPDDTWIDECIRHLGAEPIVLCTDFPHPGMNHRMGETLDETYPDLDPDVRGMLLGGNAQRIFGVA
ncbi:MAG: amidohydrolase family protein [Deltaproteobacteria bacterium]|jgi:predicted TIM-barrel fold metal-dependent hydrolase|nr:amidohydrolase family protein [Deltaproteobacteria bacterium]MBW2496992.1 amidohydrolase family protein [Deltaproteobacteria bacterium]